MFFDSRNLPSYLQSKQNTSSATCSLVTGGLVKILYSSLVEVLEVLKACLFCFSCEGSFSWSIGMIYQLRPEVPFEFCTWNRWWAPTNIPYAFYVDTCIFLCPFSAGTHFFLSFLWVEAAFSLASLMDHWYSCNFSPVLGLCHSSVSLGRGLALSDWVGLRCPMAALLCR